MAISKPSQQENWVKPMLRSARLFLQRKKGASQLERTRRQRQKNEGCSEIDGACRFHLKQFFPLKHRTYFIFSEHINFVTVESFFRYLKHRSDLILPGYSTLYTPHGEMFATRVGF